MADNSKDTIYVDVDDEITELIEKVRASDAKVVALVLPKRATVLQSIVNMKLLKRAGDNEKKNLVLITTESGLMPLAGAVGLHVASSLTSKPEIPSPPSIGESVESEAIDEDMSLPLEEDQEKPDLTKAAGASATVGALADAAHGSVPKPKTSDQLETLELDNSTEAEPPKEELKPEPKPKKDKHLKVPNFNRFRALLLIGVLVVAGLIVLAVLAFSVWPHAVIDVKTDASNVNASLSLNLDPQAQAVSASGDIPAKQVSEQKTFSQTVNTTGQKNEGNTAVGSVTMSASDCNGTYSGSSFTIPAGTGVSANNLTYITQNATTMNIKNVNLKTGCVNYAANGSTSINAQNPGANYNNSNISNASVAGYPEVSASGSASGGTDNNVQIVSQTDIDTATSKISASDSSTIKQDLINQLQGQGMYPIDVTFASGNPQTSSNPSVGDASNTVTVTETITYTMFGAAQSDLNSLLDQNIRSQTSSNQNIISNGLSQSGFKQVSANGTSDQVALNSVAEVGPNISVSEIKKVAAGKSPQAIVSAIKNNPDVTSVTVKLSPFWVSSAPSSPSKITVTVAKPSSAT